MDQALARALFQVLSSWLVPMMTHGGFSANACDFSETGSILVCDGASSAGQVLHKGPVVLNMK